jgi:hypothetical protein
MLENTEGTIKNGQSRETAFLKLATYIFHVFWNRNVPSEHDILLKDLVSHQHLIIIYCCMR